VAIGANQLGFVGVTGRRPRSSSMTRAALEGGKRGIFTVNDGMVNIKIMIFLTRSTTELYIVLMASFTEIVPVGGRKTVDASTQDPAIYFISDQEGVR
jgi:hypothetical protein